MTAQLEAFFARDEQTLVPGEFARGPWGDTIGGHIIGGLMAWAIEAIERSGGDPEFQPARLTLDLFRPAAMRAVQVEVSVRREGRRIKLIDADLLQDGVSVSRASALLLRRGSRPPGEVWTPSLAMPPVPNDSATLGEGLPFVLWAFGSDWECGTRAAQSEWEQAGHQKFAWIRQVRPVVEGEALTPFVRAALAADVTSALTHWGTAGLRYINADFTLTLSRLPDGDYVGLAFDGHHDADGVATGAATVFDRHGPIGNSIAVAIAAPSASRTPQLEGRRGGD